MRLPNDTWLARLRTTELRPKHFCGPPLWLWKQRVSLAIITAKDRKPLFMCSLVGVREGEWERWSRGGVTPPPFSIASHYSTSLVHNSRQFSPPHTSNSAHYKLHSNPSCRPVEQTNENWESCINLANSMVQLIRRAVCYRCLHVFADVSDPSPGGEFNDNMRKRSWKNCGKG